ncbi:MAG: hypothetical protein M3425_07210 [Actinomycetota bacterium]|nr:hypothetical protein [Actinomycetota bacterium]
MRCEQAQSHLSAAFDGELPTAEAAVDAQTAAAHASGCQRCSAFSTQLTTLRRTLRYEVVEQVPDVAPAVLSTIAERRHHRPLASGWRLAPVAAAFVAATVAGALFIGVNPERPVTVAAATLPERIVAAQARLQTLSATVTVVERGWHPRVPRRRYTGQLRYSAPESLALDLRDVTDYPRGGWQSNDTTVVADGGRAWTRGPVPCPSQLQPACAAPRPRVAAVWGREPFDEAAPLPLDLVLPVRSFTLAANPPLLGSRRIGGRTAVGLRTTVAQVQPLLDGLRSAGDWRLLHPADQVELWLDDASLVPLALRVRPAADTDRKWWAVRHGYRDAAGTALLTVDLRDVAVNEPLGGGAFPPAPPGADLRDAGFDDAETAAGIARPRWLPAGMRLHRAGAVSGGGTEVAIATYSDGRAWIKVRVTEHWSGDRLFGDLGPLVRAVQLPGSGTAYLAEGGRQVALHGTAVDLEVTGSLSARALRRVAASLGVNGRPIPNDWVQAGTATLAQARRGVDGLLLPTALDGFGPPAIRSSRGAVSLAYTGAGARGFLLSQVRGPHLSPPLEPDVRGVRVRGVAGRYTPLLGELEWVDSGSVVSLRSQTLSLAELLGIAKSLAPA